MADLFRKAALDKLSSPEQLDRSIRIISPSFWIAALGGAVIILCVLLWSVFGRLPVNVSASGMFLGGDGVRPALAEASGVVSKVYVKEGDKLAKGDKIAKLDNKQLKKELNALNERYDSVAAITFWSENDLATTDSKSMVDIKAQRSVTDSSLNTNRALLSEKKSERSKAKKAMKKAKKKMKKRKSALEDAEEDYQIAIDEKNEAKAQKAQEIIQEKQQLYQEAYSLYDASVQNYEASKNAVDQMKAQVSADSTNTSNQDASLEKQFDAAKDATLDAIRQEQKKVKVQLDATTLTSRIEGRITGVKVDVGTAVRAGSALCTVASNTEPLVKCFVPVAEGKKIRKGMEVVVYPSTVNRQEYGHIEGKVTDVSDYVTSGEEMLNQLGDSALVQAFQQSGPVVTVTVMLEKDKNTVSGYKWSSKKGADVALSDGTMVSADIITEEKAPITMLLPILKEKLSMQNTDQSSKGK